jgi:membrane protein implicated in regulation of membrane protease activity
MRSRGVIIGLILFGAGILTTLLVLSRLVVDTAPVVPVLWFLAMLSGVGFAVLLFWLWWQSRRRRKAVRSAVADPRSSTRI